MEPKNEHKPNNLLQGTHYFNGDTLQMEEFAEMAVNPLKIPLNKEVLEPLGFEPLYDPYTSEIYFQRDVDGYKVRVLSIQGCIRIIDLNYMHTVVDAKAGGLNELENYMAAVGCDFQQLLSDDVVKAINEFGKRYFEYYKEKKRLTERLMEY